MNKHVVFGTPTKKKTRQLITKSSQILAMSSMAALLTACFGPAATTPTTTPTPTPTPTPEGKTFELTIGKDTLTGDSGDDRFIANLPGGIETFTAGEVLNGGSGTDTLIVATKVAVFDTGIATITNIEILDVRNGGSITSIDGDGDGYTSVKLDKLTADTTISGIAATTTISVDDLDSSKLIINYSGATGSTDVANITIGIATAAGIDAADSETINLTITGAAVISTAVDFAKASKINIDAAKTTQINLSGATAAEADVTIKGAGEVALGAISSTIATVDAEDNTGGVKLTTDAATTSVKGGSGKDEIEVVVPTSTIAITGGAGDDTIDISAMDLTVALVVAGAKVTTIDGGADKDTLVIEGGDLTNVNIYTNVNKAKNFEVLQVDTAVTDFSSYPFTDINQFTFTANNTAGGARSYSVVTGDTITLTNSNSGAGITFAPLGGGATPDILNLNLVVVGADITQDDIDVTGIETINIGSYDLGTSTAEKNEISTLTLTSDAEIVVTGNADLILADLDTASGVTVNASAFTGALTVAMTDGADTITLAASASAANKIVFGATAAANGTNTITGFVAGTDKIDVNAFETVGAVVNADGFNGSVTAGTVYYLFSQAANAADSTAATITALNAAATLADSDDIGWLVISDDNSTTIYEWDGDNAGGNEATGDTLTVIATLDSVMTAAGDILIA